MSIELIDKRDNTVKQVSEDYKIEYAGQKVALKDLQYEDMKVFGVIIQEDGEINLRYKKEVDCDHEFRAISNNWRHWNTGILMTRGRCVKCGIEKEIRFSMVKKRVKDIE